MGYDNYFQKIMDSTHLQSGTYGQTINCLFLMNLPRKNEEKVIIIIENLTYISNIYIYCINYTFYHRDLDTFPMIK